MWLPFATPILLLVVYLIMKKIKETRDAVLGLREEINRQSQQPPAAGPDDNNALHRGNLEEQRLINNSAVDQMPGAHLEA